MLSSTGTVPARDINKPTAPRQRTIEGGIGQGNVSVISPVHTIEAAIISLLRKPNWSEWDTDDKSSFLMNPCPKQSPAAALILHLAF